MADNNIEDPLYLHPSDTTGLLLIPFQLQGSNNYHAWSTAMKEGLLVKNKIGFVDGSFPRLSVPVAHHVRWDRANAIVKAWLRNTVAKELVNGLVYNTTAASIWQDLKEMFDKVDGTQVFQLTREIYQCSQGALSITEYFGKMKQLWDALGSIDDLRLECSADSKLMNEYKEKQRLIAFLLGLNESFAHVRSSLLMRIPLPSLSVAFSVLLQEESQRAIAGSIGDVGEATALYSQRNFSNVRGGGGYNYGHGSGSGGNAPRPNVPSQRPFGGNGGSSYGGSNASSNASTGKPGKIDKSSWLCTYCGKNGHKVDTCWKKYPHLAIASSQKRPWNAANVSMDESPQSLLVEHVAAGDKRIFHGTAEKRVLHTGMDRRVQHVAIQDDFEPLSYEEDELVRVNMAGISHSSNSSMIWIVDSGATNHITHNLDWLHNLRRADCNHQFVHLPNGTKCKVTHMGSCSFSSGFTLDDILYVPDFKFNLISVSKLPTQLNCKVIFTFANVLLQGQVGKPMVIGERSKGLYTLKDSVPSCTSKVVAAHTSSKSNKDDAWTWHRRLGHISSTHLSHLNDVLCLNDSTNNCVKQCTICPLAKQTRLSFPYSQSHASTPFALIHLDLWGPYKVPTIRGYQYFLTIVDDFSRATWVFLMKHKSETFIHIQNFLLMVQTQFGALVKIVRSDNGSEFINSICKDHFLHLGIMHQTSCVYTPQQNGRVERKHRQILNVARALRFQASMPIKYWGYCVLTACYLINRTPSSTLAFKSPMEVLYGKSPSLGHLRVIGSLCFATKLHNLDKFGSRSEPCILMGYSTSQKGYIVMRISDSSFQVSRDVIFHEHIFPFSMSKEELRSLLPTCLDPKLHDGDTSSVDHGTFVDAPLVPSPVFHTPNNDHPTPVVVPPSIQPIQPVQPLRRSARLAQLRGSPSSNVAFGMEKYISYDHLGPNFACFLASIDKIKEPSTYKQAVKDPNWVIAMKDEINALQDNNTWKIMALPPGKSSIGCKWVFRVKYNSDGSIERYKARLVAKGFTQVEGTDFNETFSPVVKMTTVRVVLAMAASYSWGLFHMDVNNAFLQGDLHEEVYMDIPQGFDSTNSNPGSPRRVCKLLKSLYGLKQASRQWNIKLTETLVKNGYIQSASDHSLFTKVDGKDSVFLLIYVDDLLITGSNAHMIDQLKSTLKSHFKLKDLGNLRYFLGLEIARSKEGLVINQRKYALELIEEAGLGAARPSDTPMEFNLKLTTHEFDVATHTSKDDLLLEDPTAYRRLVGKLLYLTMTRPDISFCVQRLSQFVDKPKKSHQDAAIRVIKYIKGCPGQGLLYPSNNTLDLSLYCDSDWAACPFSRKSVSAYCVKLGDAMVGWKVKKQDTISLSSAEAEYRCLRVAIQEALWIARLLKELGLHLHSPIPIFTDSESALKIAKNPMFHERTKHIELDCHFTRHHIQSGHVSPMHIASRDQLADLLTKALIKKQHIALLRLYGIKDVFHEKKEEEKGGSI